MISTLIRYVITFGFVGGIFACDEIVDRFGIGLNEQANDLL